MSGIIELKKKNEAGVKFEKKMLKMLQTNLAQIDN